MALAIDGNEPIQFTPRLLLGEPGLGKTHFAKSMAKVLGTSFEFLSMSSLTAGWIFTGASSQWNNVNPSKVAHALINDDFANPLITLDELGKAGGDSRYDLMGSLYGLLEHDTALHFKGWVRRGQYRCQQHPLGRHSQQRKQHSRPNPESYGCVRCRQSGPRWIHQNCFIYLSGHPQAA